MLFAEDLFVTLVFVWEIFFLLTFLFDYFWDDNRSADVVSVLVGFPRGVLVSWHEEGFLCVGRLEDDGEMGMVYSPSLPVNIWLGAHEPGISEDCFLFS